MKNHTIIALLWGFISCFANAQDTERKMLSGQSTEDGVFWDFFCTSGQNSGKWTQIRVPSCWELEGFGAYNYGHDRDKADEKGLYRTSFTLPESWEGKRIFIVFEGSMTDTKVSVNRIQAGEIHQGAFYRFKREITALVNPKAENQLEVEVSKMSSNASVNSAERDADFWVFGGIFRPVYLEAVPADFIEYTAIDATQDGTINIAVYLDKAMSEASVKVDVFEAHTGKRVADFEAVQPSASNCLTASSRLEGIKPWTAETPHLYKAIITVSRKGKSLHSVSERFGFRTVEVRERDGVYINGKKIRFKGVNRHCFWPSTGRTVSPAQSLEDVRLIKKMNMNAVRMSHYPPDTHFLEYCDSLGLYVIDELCAWQRPPYDTPVGAILVNEMLKKDINHPSIIFWANGNEGGFNLDLDPLFPALDIQKRPVIHPFGLYGSINTVHYITYNSGMKDMFNGRDIFMPTELLHGLYDGGHGAGLDDFWNLMRSNPLSAGMFLWDFSDQGVVRTDKNGILDTDKDHGADGILGPYREKEGSFYTIKEIWSPVFLEKKYLTLNWNGVFTLENRYDFTNIKECGFQWRLARYISLDGDLEEVYGQCAAPDIPPGHKGELSLSLPADWKEYDVLYLTAFSPEGGELFTWSHEVNGPAFFAERMLRQWPVSGKVAVTDSSYIFSVGEVKMEFSKATGLLVALANGKGVIPLSNGPVFVMDGKVECRRVTLSELGELPVVNAVYHYPGGGEAYRFTWTLQEKGVLQLDYSYRPSDNLEMAGVSFDFPEEGIAGARLFANGPYRVYNNRLKGGSLGVWNKEYNDAITGEVWDYPEFKGYYSLFYGMRLECPTPLEVYSASEDLFLHLFTPTIQQNYNPARNFTFPNYPKGNLSFMDEIPSVGTKFGEAGNFGPQSQRHRFKGYSATPDMRNRVYFRF